MAPNKSPAFQFYPKDFMAGTATMSLQEVGAYVRLLCYAWDAGSVPNNEHERARILGCAKAQERELWKKVGQKFILADDVYLNERMEEERKKQSEYRRRQSDRGKASAAAREVNQRSNAGSTSVQPSVVEVRLQPEGNSSSSSSVPKDSKNESLGGEKRPPTIIARGEGVKWFQRHGNHIDGFCDWVCLDLAQVDEFAGRIPGPDLQPKRDQIKLWAQAVRDTWSDRIVPDGSHFDFWRNRWTEQHGGSRPANATLKAVKAANDLDEAFR